MSTTPQNSGSDGETRGGIHEEDTGDESFDDSIEIDPFQDAELLAAQLPAEEELSPGADSLPTDDEAGLVPGLGPDGPRPATRPTGSGDTPDGVPSEDEEQFDAG